MFKFTWKEMELSHKLDQVPVISSDKEFNKHYHNFYEIFYFISGTAMYTVENEKRPLNSGDALIIKPGEFHNVEFLNSSPYERYVLKVPIEFIPQYLAEKPGAQSAFFPNHPEVGPLFASLDNAFNTFSGYDMYYYGGSVATQIAISLCASGSDSQNYCNLANSQIIEVLKYINDNLEKPLTMNDIAEAFHYSPDCLSRKFYSYMGTSIMKYVRTKRILAARKMLTLGIKPTQVAERLNFSDYSTFYRSYVSITGKSPSDDPFIDGETVFQDD